MSLCMDPLGGRSAFAARDADTSPMLDLWACYIRAACWVRSGLHGSGGGEWCASVPACQGPVTFKVCFHFAQTTLRQFSQENIDVAHACLPACLHIACIQYAWVGGCDASGRARARVSPTELHDMLALTGPTGPLDPLGVCKPAQKKRRAQNRTYDSDSMAEMYDTGCGPASAPASSPEPRAPEPPCPRGPSLPCVPCVPCAVQVLYHITIPWALGVLGACGRRRRRARPFQWFDGG